MIKIKQKGFYAISEHIKQKGFLRLIDKINDLNRINDLNLDIIISTNWDKPSNLVDLRQVFSSEEYSSILEEKDVYKTIGYITLKSLEISKIKVYINDTSIVFYPSSIYFPGGKEELKKILISLQLNPNTYLYNSKHIVKTPEQDAPWYNEVK